MKRIFIILYKYIQYDQKLTSGTNIQLSKNLLLIEIRVVQNLHHTTPNTQSHASVTQLVSVLNGTLNAKKLDRCQSKILYIMTVSGVDDVMGQSRKLHQTDTACSWLVCHSRGDCSGEHCANCIHLPRLSGGPASQFFGEASRAFPQHGWRSAYSLRETLSPTQDQGQHLRPLHTHPTTHTHQVH